MSHTPGPWHTEHVRRTACKDPTVRIWGNGLKLIANVHLHSGDAELIAAAPDLLAALERLVAEAQAGDFSGMTYEYFAGREGLALARAAIKKAKGEA